MSMEQEIRELALSVSEIGGHRGLGLSGRETNIDLQLEAIWSALLLIAQKLDTRD